MKHFWIDFNFKHVTSSPYYSQSNGGVEGALKIAKNILKKNYIAQHLEYDCASEVMAHLPHPWGS